MDEAGGGTEGRAGHMEDSSQHLEHCAVDIRELSAIPKGLTAGELTTPCLSVCLSADQSALVLLPVLPEITKYVFSAFKSDFCLLQIFPHSFAMTVSP